MTEQLEEFRSNLNLVKSMTGDKAEEEFYQLMEKTKTVFGELNLYMGEFYFEYAKFLLQKMEKNIDIFNSNMLPAEQAAAQQNPIPEMLEDDSSLQNQNNSQDPKSENNLIQNGKQVEAEPKQKMQENGLVDQPVITENNDEQKNNHKNQPNLQVQPEQAGQQVAQGQPAGEDDDFQVCAQNLLCAIKIFETQRDRLQEGGQEGIYTLAEVLKWLSRCRSRLGDLYHLSQNYTQAVAVYKQVIEDQEKKQGHESNRGLAEIHYMIANSFLYDNKQGCEKIAIKQFIKSVQILLNHLSVIDPSDTTIYQAPSQEKVKVDRFAYLPKSTDSDEVKQIKEVISCLLDKIEDTFQQIGIRAQYQAERQKTKQQQQQSKFKQVNPNVPVIKLGTFGNRKKKAEQLPDEQLKKRNS